MRTREETQAMHIEALRLRLEGYTYQVIGERLHVSRQRAQQILTPPRAIRQILEQRTDGECEGCGLYVGHSGHAHHRASVGLTDNSYHDLDNLQWLCRSCHRTAHAPSATRPLPASLAQYSYHYIREHAKAIRHQLKLTQEAFAMLMGVSHSTITKWEARGPQLGSGSASGAEQRREGR